MGRIDGRTLFVDLDGVMADFDGAFFGRFGVDHRKIPDADMWALIDADGRYFRDLPPCAGALEFFRSVRHLDPVILTAAPAEKFAEIAWQKREWVREHLGRDIPVLPCPGGKNKALYMHRVGDILIDDFARNIERWDAAGGAGILHSGDFAATAERVRQVIGEKWLTRQPASGTSRAPSADPKTTSRATTTDTRTASPPAATTGNPLPDLPRELGDVYPGEASMPWT